MSRTADPGLQQALAAIEQRDWKALTPLLHPYLHWTRPDGHVLRGRKNVLAYLAVTSVETLPEDYELRDGQIYRWVEP